MRRDKSKGASIFSVYHRLVKVWSQMLENADMAMNQQGICRLSFQFDLGFLIQPLMPLNRGPNFAVQNGYEKSSPDQANFRLGDLFCLIDSIFDPTRALWISVRRGSTN